jgi:hypothetical protein
MRKEATPRRLLRGKRLSRSLCAAAAAAAAAAAMRSHSVRTGAKQRGRRSSTRRRRRLRTATPHQSTLRPRRRCTRAQIGQLHASSPFIVKHGSGKCIFCARWQRTVFIYCYSDDSGGGVTVLVMDSLSKVPIFTLGMPAICYAFLLGALCCFCGPAAASRARQCSVCHFCRIIHVIQATAEAFASCII